MEALTFVLGDVSSWVSDISTGFTGYAKDTRSDDLQNSSHM